MVVPRCRRCTYAIAAVNGLGAEINLRVIGVVGAISPCYGYSARFLPVIWGLCRWPSRDWIIMAVGDR